MAHCKAQRRAGFNGTTPISVAKWRILVDLSLSPRTGEGLDGDASPEGKLMPGLTPQQLHDFLTGGRRLLKLATLTEDGYPYVVPLWYDYDGEAFSVAGRRRARWVANIRRDGRVGGLVDTEEAAYVRGGVPGPRRDHGRRLAALLARAGHPLPGRGGRPALLRIDPPRAAGVGAHRAGVRAKLGRAGVAPPLPGVAGGLEHSSGLFCAD